MREREVKLAVDDSFVVPDLDDAVEGAVLGAPEERAISDVYFDTEDLRLIRWGCTLRNRKGAGWTVKLPVVRKPQSTAVFRDEIHFRGRAGKPPAAALALVDSFTRGAPVDVVARFNTRRVARQWHTAEGQLLVELVDDTVTSEPTAGHGSVFRQLEVELAPEADLGLLDVIVQRLTVAGARPDRVGLKLALALGDRATQPPDVVVPPAGKDSTAREVIRAALARSVTQLMVELPAARLGIDVEGVHQARVATRRLRSDLRTFRPLLEPTWTASLDQRLQSLAGHLGRVRDCDVLMARLCSAIDAHREIDGESGPRIIELLGEDQIEARAELIDQLDTEAMHRLLDDLVAAAADPVTRPQAEGAASRKLRGLVRKRWRRLDRAVKSLGSEPPIEALHKVRILAKRTRYAAEAVSPAFGSKARKFAKQVTGIQDVLGELHDAAVAERWLTAHIDRLDPPTAFAAGRLAQLMTDEGLQNRHGWETAYRRAAKRPSRSWFA